MAETKAADLQRQVDELQADNERLRGQLATAGAVPASVAPVLRQLSEGNRVELEQLGYTAVGGTVYTSPEARALVKATGQDVEWNDPAPERMAEAEAIVGRLRVDPSTGAALAGQGVRGLTHVWPSVQPGGIDPAVAGRPGVSGPAAGSDEHRLAQQTPAANVGTTETPKA